jgi:hypothetical protein
LPLRLRQRPPERVELGPLARLPQVQPARALGRRRQAQVVDRDPEAVAHDHRPLDPVLELADVAGQAWASIARQRRLGEAARRPAQARRELAQQVVRQEDGVARPPAQRWDLDRDLGQPVVEVLAERAVGDHARQVPVGGRDHPRVHGDLAPAADPLDHPLLEEPEQLRLQAERQVADLVQEQCPAVRQLDLAWVCFAAPVKAPRS